MTADDNRRTCQRQLIPAQRLTEDGPALEGRPPPDRALRLQLLPAREQPLALRQRRRPAPVRNWGKKGRGREGEAAIESFIIGRRIEIEHRLSEPCNPQRTLSHGRRPAFPTTMIMMMTPPRLCRRLVLPGLVGR